MRTIWKFPLEITDNQTIEIPSDEVYGYQILHINTQNNVPTIWVEINPDAKKIPIRIVILGTGLEVTEEFLDNFIHVGTCITHNDKLVWHVFVHCDDYGT